MDWYYVDNGERRGPCSEEELAHAFMQGRMQTETLVWRQGLSDWISCEEALARGLWKMPDSTPNFTPNSIPLSTIGAEMAGNDATCEMRSPLPREDASGGEVLVCNQCGGSYGENEVALFGQWTICGWCKPLYAQRLKEGGTYEFGLLPGASWPRFGAFVVDTLLWMFIGAFIGAFMPFIPLAKPKIVLALNVFPSLLSVFYIVYMNGRWGATIGKMVFNLKIVDANGQPPGYWKAFLRSLAQTLSFATLFIGYLMIFMNKEKRSLHDYMTGTRVIRNL